MSHFCILEMKYMIRGTSVWKMSIGKLPICRTVHRETIRRGTVSRESTLIEPLQVLYHSNS